MAVDDGVTKILAGDGGDELFGGNARYAKQRLFDHYQNVPGGLQKALLEPLLGSGLTTHFALTRNAQSVLIRLAHPSRRRLTLDGKSATRQRHGHERQPKIAQVAHLMP